MRGRSRDALGEFAVVGEQQQAFAVIIEPAHRIDARLDAAQQVASPSARPSGSVTVVTKFLGLLQREVDGLLGRADASAVHFDVIALEVGLGSQFGNHCAVDRDAAFHDQLLGFAAAGDAGVRRAIFCSRSSGI